MQSCEDHPNNMAVESCIKCGRLICGLHDDTTCMNHGGEENPKWLLLVLAAMSITFVSIVMTIITNIWFAVQSGGITQPSDIVFADGETISFSNPMTIFRMLLLVSVPLVVVLVIILIRLSRQAEEPAIQFAATGRSTYFCMGCGNELSIDTDECSKCGRNTANDRKFVD